MHSCASAHRWLHKQCPLLFPKQVRPAKDHTHPIQTQLGKLNTVVSNNRSAPPALLKILKVFSQLTTECPHPSWVCLRRLTL